jgi:tetratricopeptide (TPR) repeat protein
MSLLGIFKEKPRIKGIIGYFGLADWWLTEFSDSERQHIQERFQPLGSSGSSLIEDDISYTSVTAVGFLHVLAGWFAKSEERHIAYKILKKAEELVNDKTKPLDVHLLYGTKVGIYYKDRDMPGGLEKAIQACKQQISYAEKAAKAFNKEYKNSLPSHKGYEQLAIILEKQHKYSEAIEICQQALKQGWAGDWERRIERCRKKVRRSGAPCS